MRGAVVVLLQEFVVVLGEVGRSREEGVEFRVDDFRELVWEWFGKLGEGVTEADGLFVGSWVGG